MKYLIVAFWGLLFIAASIALTSSLGSVNRRLRAVTAAQAPVAGIALIDSSRRVAAAFDEDLYHELDCGWLGIRYEVVTLQEGIRLGCRPCKYCMKEQTTAP